MKSGDASRRKTQTAPGDLSESTRIEYLRHKQFVFIKNIDDQLLVDPKFGVWMSEHCDAIRLFLITWAKSN